MAHKVECAIRSRLDECGLQPDIRLNPGPGDGYVPYVVDGARPMPNFFRHQRRPREKRCYPRLGAFEVLVSSARHHSGVVIFSKLESKMWPVPSVLAERIFRHVVKGWPLDRPLESTRDVQACSVPTRQTATGLTARRLKELSDPLEWTNSVSSSCAATVSSASDAPRQSELEIPSPFRNQPARVRLTEPQAKTLGRQSPRSARAGVRLSPIRHTSAVQAPGSSCNAVPSQSTCVGTLRHEFPSSASDAQQVKQVSSAGRPVPTQAVVVASAPNCVSLTAGDAASDDVVGPCAAPQSPGAGPVDFVAELGAGSPLPPLAGAPADPAVPPVTASTDSSHVEATVGAAVGSPEPASHMSEAAPASRDAGDRSGLCEWDSEQLATEEISASVARLLSNDVLLRLFQHLAQSLAAAEVLLPQVAKQFNVSDRQSLVTALHRVDSRLDPAELQMMFLSVSGEVPGGGLDKVVVLTQAAVRHVLHIGAHDDYESFEA